MKTVRILPDYEEALKDYTDYLYIQTFDDGDTYYYFNGIQQGFYAAPAGIKRGELSDYDYPIMSGYYLYLDKSVIKLDSEEELINKIIIKLLLQ